MLNALYLVGAYGRQYNTKELMIKDWLDGKDFRIKGGQYISIRDMIPSLEMDKQEIGHFKDDVRKYDIFNYIWE